MTIFSEYQSTPLNWGDLLAGLFVVGLFIYAWHHDQGRGSGK